jgi:hypothetical protein
MVQSASAVSDNIMIREAVLTRDEEGWDDMGNRLASRL